MGIPESLAEFEIYMDEGIEIYIEKSVLGKYVIDNETLMVIEGIGRFKLENIENRNVE